MGTTCVVNIIPESVYGQQSAAARRRPTLGCGDKKFNSHPLAPIQRQSAEKQNVRTPLFFALRRPPPD
jgi:hypothetical protein